MKIAVLAWGSLYWSPRGLKIDDSPWKDDGPNLPIEFSRIASDGRLTLVIDPEYKDVQSYWHIMDVADLEEARLNLQEREGAESIDEIGYVYGDVYQISDNSEFLISRIKKWVAEKNLDVVIWTDLAPKFKEKTGIHFSESSAINYLLSLEGDVWERAKEYILKTPNKTETTLRKSLEDCIKKKSL